MSQSEHPRPPRLFLLGPPRLEQDGATVPITTRKAMALLAYLAVTQQFHSREALATLFWAEYDRSRAFANLRRTLWLLNKVLGKEWLEADAETIGLRHEAGLWLDVTAFRDHLTDCPTEEHMGFEACPTCLTSLTKAVTLHRDDFMAGFTLPDSPAFDEWQFFEREGLRSELASALERLVRCHSAQRDYESAISHARRWVALDSFHEPAHRALMRLYAWDGHWAAATRQYQECARILEEELGAQPDGETRQLYKEIQARQLPLLPGDTGRAPLTPVPLKNLPAHPTVFVGREAELAQIAQMFEDPDCRLLTLVGPGGVGKSRLALEAALQQADLSPARYAHGVSFVPLACVSGAEFVVSSIASALGFSFYGHEEADARRQLLSYLRKKQMLLLLDNLEHLLEVADLLSGILEHAPGVRLLATSRERLNLQGEWVFEVSGLRYPVGEPVESLEGYDAVQLFLRRASQVDSGFSPSGEQIPDLIDICRLVDGLPLAIELAATWTKVLSCREIVEHLSGRQGPSLDLLTSSLRDVPERHRSLRAVCDSSWELLSEEEQRTFARLSVFRGEFDREAATQVAGARLPLLAALVDKSLVRSRPSGRYDVHPILQEYAAERLGADRQAEAEARDQHSAYFMAFLQRREGAMKGADQMQAMVEVEKDLDNVRAAWRWAIDQGWVAEIRRAAPGLWLYYEMRGPYQEGEQAFARAVGMLDARADQEVEASLALGLTLAFQGWFVGRRYDAEKSGPLKRRSLQILRQLGASEELGLALSFAFYRDTVGSVAEAEKLLHQSLAINRKLDRQWEVAFSLLEFCGSVWFSWFGQVDVDPYLRESHATFSEIGDRRLAAYALMQMAGRPHLLGRVQLAKQRLEDSLVVLRQFGDGKSVQFGLDQLGSLARRLGQYEEARQLHRDSLEVASEVDDRLGVAGSLDHLGLVSYDMGDYESAERYLEESLAIRMQVGHSWSIGVSFGHLGDVALAQGEVHEALRRYRQMLDAVEDFEYLQVDAWRHIAKAHLALGDAAQAGQDLQTALEIAMRSGATSKVLDTLRVVAQLAARRGETEWAVEVLTHPLEHPSSALDAQAKAERLLADLASRLPPEVVDAAQERGRGRTLDEIVRESLEVLGD